MSSISKFNSNQKISVQIQNLRICFSIFKDGKLRSSPIGIEGKKAREDFLGKNLEILKERSFNPT